MSIDKKFIDHFVKVTTKAALASSFLVGKKDKIACDKALNFMPEKISDSVAASDAFFPFPDGVQELINAGVKCIIQPGGSINDKNVIKAVNESGAVMVFTGTRHFKH